MRIVYLGDQIYRLVEYDLPRYKAAILSKSQRLYLANYSEFQIDREVQDQTDH